MRLRWANSISTFFRARRETAYSSVLAMFRAMSRAPSWMERRTFLEGCLGQQRGFSAQAPQSCWVAR
jgi:hypothetical protein